MTFSNYVIKNIYFNCYFLIYYYIIIFVLIPSVLTFSACVIADGHAVKQNSFL